MLIGIGAILLNGARVGSHSIIAAGTVLGEGQQVPEGVLVAGVPGKVRRELTEAERAAIARNAATYLEITRLTPSRRESDRLPYGRTRARFLQ